MWTYHNPVEIVAGTAAFDSLVDHIADQPFGLVTYSDSYFETLTDRLCKSIGRSPEIIIDQVATNPDLSNVKKLCSKLQSTEIKPKVLIALGGGSVLDACKVLSACSGDYDAFIDYLKERSELPASIPFIAIPTTSGTGSEVTCWATIWDPENGKKHSLAHPSLYAKSAILSPNLTLELPWEITLSSALDALSHALESLWNINRNPISSLYAVRAAKSIVALLPNLKETYRQLITRETLQQASLYAGLAFSNTKTSIAHNISYPITLKKGVSHGIACSFTLPMILRAIDGSDIELQSLIRKIFGCDHVEAAHQLERTLHQLGVASNPAEYGYTPDQWQDLLSEAAQGNRGQNYSGNIKSLMSLYRNYSQYQREVS